MLQFESALLLLTVRQTPYKKKEKITFFVSKLPRSNLFFLFAWLFTKTKSTNPNDLTSEPVPACASRGSNPAHPD